MSNSHPRSSECESALEIFCTFCFRIANPIFARMFVAFTRAFILRVHRDFLLDSFPDVSSPDVTLSDVEVGELRHVALTASTK